MVEKKESTEKPLDKMTVKELREVAKEIPEITGVYGMNKPELLSAIKGAKGIKEAPKKVKSTSVGEIKKKISDFKQLRKAALEAKDAKKAKIYKRRISRLKKKSRRVA